MGKGWESKMASILYVRAKSQLRDEELNKILMERKPRFKEVPGLLQKVYGRDKSTGEVCGIYFFETEKALKEFSETELAKTIASAYEVVELRNEVYNVLYSLYPDRGPFTE